MIHLLGWIAVSLTAAHSYNIRAHLDPHGVLEHRAGLPAMAYAAMMLLSLAVLVTLTGAGGAHPGALDAPAIFDQVPRTGTWS